MEGGEDEAVSWPPLPNNRYESNDAIDEEMNFSISSFKSMLETADCFNNSETSNPYPDFSYLSFNPLALDSSSSCSSSQAHAAGFTLDPSQAQIPFSLTPPKSFLPPLLFNNNFDYGYFDLGYESNFFPAQDPDTASASMLMGFNQFQQTSEFPPTTSRLLPISGDNGVGEGSNTFDFGEGLSPMEAVPPIGTHQHPQFQKRAALRQNLGVFSSKSDEGLNDRSTIELGIQRKRNDYEDEIEDDMFTTMNYGDSDELTENFGVGNSNANSSVTDGDDRGKKKKGMPAKNLMAERRRRKKLNDRLYMLRSIVPKISKMDRASILGDSIDYLKELLQRIKDLHNELEATQQGSHMRSTTSFHPLTPTPPTLPYRVKEEMCVSSMPSPKNQPARVEVRLREGRAVNIHMFCARRPGLLLSAMRALDNLGLEIQQAVISCFNGFALDVFRAEQCREGDDILLPEQIKSVLLDFAGFHGVL